MLVAGGRKIIAGMEKVFLVPRHYPPDIYIL
jgi:hypothetical protein